MFSISGLKRILAPLDPNDIAMITHMERCTVTGTILPSGAKVPYAPDGMCYITQNGQIKLSNHSFSNQSF